MRKCQLLIHGRKKERRGNETTDRQTYEQMDRHTDAQYRLTDIEKQRYRYTRRGRERKTQSDTHTHTQTEKNR